MPNKKKNKSTKKKIGTKKGGGAKVSGTAKYKYGGVNRRTPADKKRYDREMKSLKSRGDKVKPVTRTKTNVNSKGAVSKVKSRHKYKPGKRK